MTNEASVSCGLKVTKGTSIRFTTVRNSFLKTVSGAKGPSPGAIDVTELGTDINFSELDDPGLVHFMNQSTLYRVDIGIWDGVSFYPMIEIPAGEEYTMCLSRNLGEEYQSGTGTTGAAINTLRAKVVGAPGDTLGTVSLLVEAFER